MGRCLITSLLMITGRVSPALMPNNLLLIYPLMGRCLEMFVKAEDFAGVPEKKGMRQMRRGR